MAYRGKYRIKNIGKYIGDPTNVVYRSLWERQTFVWLDNNPNVKSWSSEEVIIPYLCKTDNKMHRYFVDLKVTFTNNVTYLIEIKPEKETKEPKKRAKQTKGYIKEVMTYVKNTCKWTTAEKFCEARGWTFAVWTEKHLKSLGIKLLLSEIRKGK